MDRPDILIVVADRLDGRAFRDGLDSALQAPALAALAARARRFARCYAAAPSAVAARAALATGCLPSRTGVFDDGAELSAAQPSFAHHLRRDGYHTVLAGTLRFVGPDQLHGFEERLTGDVDRVDFAATPVKVARTDDDAEDDGWPEAPPDPPEPDMPTLDAYDDEVASRAAARLAALVERRDGRPWCLVAAFAGPRQPATRVEEERGRAAIAALDARLATILAALPDGPHAPLVVFTAARGAGGGRALALGEAAMRVPMFIAGPGIAPERLARPASTLDLAPTLAGLTGAEIASNGASLLAEDRPPVPMEMTCAPRGGPVVGLVADCWKYLACLDGSPRLYDLVDDPGEATDLADLSPGQSSAMAAEIDARWNLAALDRAIRLSRARRRLVHAALSVGRPCDWRHQPPPVA
jgi:choline-sulfatase